MTNMDAELLELQADEKGEFTQELGDESSVEEAENLQYWEQRKAAVNDANYNRERDRYEKEMKLLAEREKVIERERKLLEMKEGLAQRHKQIKQMEAELASRNAVLDRYEERILLELDKENWVADKTRAINEWVEKAGNIESVQKGKQVQFTETMQADALMRERALIDNTGTRKAQYNRNNMFNDAMALTNDGDLIECRETGTSRLRGMGLSQEFAAPKKGRRSEPLVDLPQKTEHKGMTKQMNTSHLPMTAEMTMNNPVIGKPDDGESLCSHDSRVSIEAVKSEMESKRKIKSGMYAKVADDVVRQLKWPHKKLATRWVPARLQMNQLTFEQVVAGELAIIQRATDPEEVRSRIHILQKIAYWNMQSEGWPRVQEVYMSILHAIEEGEANFTATFDEYDSMFPVRRHNTQNKKTINRKDVFWCRAYNRAQCVEEAPHKATIAGTERLVQHICATCWKQGKKEQHAENDPACPQKEL